jgi:hypothetical protein
MPCSVIEPVPKLVEAIGDEVLGSSEVKPWVNWRFRQLSTVIAMGEFGGNIHSWMILSNPRIEALAICKAVEENTMLDSWPK